MKIALLGGTFNPIHNGHLLLAEKVKKKFRYDKIIFIPSFLPAHKEVSDSITADERLQMLKIALNEYSWADYSDCEILRKGISYTIDTLIYIHDHYKLTDNPGLIIGDDLAVNFQTWRQPEKISSMADLIIAHRLYDYDVPIKLNHRYIDNEIFTLSSSQIREMIKKGEDVRDNIPVKVFNYINHKGLYLGAVSKN